MGNAIYVFFFEMDEGSDVFVMVEVELFTESIRGGISIFSFKAGFGLGLGLTLGFSAACHMSLSCVVFPLSPHRLSGISSLSLPPIFLGVEILLPST